MTRKSTDVIQLANRTAVQRLLHELNRFKVTMIETRGQRLAITARGFHHTACSFNAIGQRFFTQHMFTGFHGGDRDFFMKLRRSGDDDRVQRLHFQQLAKIGEASGTGLCCQRLCALFVPVRHRRKTASFREDQGLGAHLADAASANKSKLHECYLPG